MANKKKKLTVKEFDETFDKDESILNSLDLKTATRKVNVDFPLWIIEELDRESSRQGISRQALIKTWITNKVDAISKKTG